MVLEKLGLPENRDLNHLSSLLHFQQVLWSAKRYSTRPRSCDNPAQALLPKRAVAVRARAHGPLHGATHAKVYTLPTALGKGIIVPRDECTTIVVAEEVDVARASR